MSIVRELAAFDWALLPVVPTRNIAPKSINLVNVTGPSPTSRRMDHAEAPDVGNVMPERIPQPCAQRRAAEDDFFRKRRPSCPVRVLTHWLNVPFEEMVKA